MRTFSHQLAYLLVIAIAVAAVGLVRATADWTRWVVASAGGVGIAGIVLASVAAVNLVVPRTCATDNAGVKETNRPAFSIVLGSDDCYENAVGQFQILGVLIVAVSAVAVRRSARGAQAPRPAARQV